MGFVTFVARVLIVTAIASSAFSHLDQPDRHLQEFKDNYAVVDGLSQTYLQFDLPYDNVLISTSRPTGPSG